jgi:hypothetical protein
MLKNLGKTKKSDNKKIDLDNYSETNDVYRKQLGEIMQKLEASAVTNREILKSVKFIKNYFFWQSTYSFLKVVLILSVIVLGYLSWPTIMDYVLKIYG